MRCGRGARPKGSRSAIPNAILPQVDGSRDNFVSIGCISKSSDGELRVTDWRGGEWPSVAGALVCRACATPLASRRCRRKSILYFPNLQQSSPSRNDDELAPDSNGGSECELPITTSLSVPAVIMHGIIASVAFAQKAPPGPPINAPVLPLARKTESREPPIALAARDPLVRKDAD
jgi:hypothetical protein